MSEWSQPIPFLPPGQPRQNTLILRFREEPRRNVLMSKDGPNVYDRVFQVMVMAIGQKQGAPEYDLMKITEGVEKICEYAQHQRFQEPFERWRKHEAPSIDGMPLEQWPLMTSDLVRAFKDANILTVEHLANASDGVAHNVRAPFQTWKAKAKAWLDEAREKGADIKARAENAQLRTELEDLKKQMGELVRAQNGLSGAPLGFDAPKKRRKRNGAEAPIVIPEDEPDRV